MALTIAVGFVVDDAIVMVEAIWRRVEHGQRPFQAALAGSREIGFTILTISISLIAVFTPVMFMGGVVGIIMREFALTLSAAVLVSVVLSLTLTPMLCARYPDGTRSRRPRASSRRWRTASGGSSAATPAGSRSCCATRSRPSWCSAARWRWPATLYATARTGFFPQQDTGFLQGTLVAPQGASFANTDKKALEAAKIIAAGSRRL